MLPSSYSRLSLRRVGTDEAHASGSNRGDEDERGGRACCSCIVGGGTYVCNGTFEGHRKAGASEARARSRSPGVAAHVASGADWRPRNVCGSVRWAGMELAARVLSRHRRRKRRHGVGPPSETGKRLPARATRLLDVPEQPRAEDRMPRKVEVCRACRLRSTKAGEDRRSHLMGFFSPSPQSLCGPPKGKYRSTWQRENLIISSGLSIRPFSFVDIFKKGRRWR